MTEFGYRCLTARTEPSLLHHDLQEQLKSENLGVSSLSLLEYNPPDSLSLAER